MADNWYFSAEQIKEKIDAVNQTNLVGANKVRVKDILSQRLEWLKQLQTKIYAKEQKFYGSINSIRYLAAEPKRALEELQKKVEQWNASGVRHMISNDSLGTILQILTSSEYRRMSTAEFEEIASDFIFNSSEIQTYSEDILNQLLTEAINKVLEQNHLQKLPSKKQSGEQRIYFEVKQDEKGNYFLKVEGDLSPNLKSALKRSFKLLLEDRKKDTSAFSDSARNARMLEQIITAPIHDSAVKNAVSAELKVGRVELYNLAKEFGVIKGFLGEVYWTAFFRYLGLDALPTGDVKDNDTNQSISVDLLVKGFGFQVKNFNLRNGTTALGSRGNYKRAGVFIRDRANIDEPLSDLLMELYGLWSYGNVASDNEAYNATRQELYNVLTSGSEKIFQHYVDKIIRLDAEQSHKFFEDSDSFFPDQKLMFNSFFLVGEKIIPSSAILQEIIESLENSAQTPSIKFSITGLQAGENAPKYPEAVEWDSYKMANFTGLGYNIDLDLTTILDRAYTKALS